MRFKAELRNIRTFSKVVAALSPLDKIAWLHLEDDIVRFIVIPDRGSQVWSVFHRDFLFDNYLIHSLSAHNSIDIELPLASLQRALKSALNSTDAVLRLTKRDGVPVLSMTIHTMTNPRGGFGAFAGGGGFRRSGFTREGTLLGDTLDEASQRREEAMVVSVAAATAATASTAIDLTTVKREREKTVTQDIPVRVLSAEATQNTTEPVQPEADVHIVLPPLLQLKAVSDRFTKLAHTTTSRGGGGGGGGFSTQGLSSLLGTAGGFGGGGNNTSSSSSGSKLELSANMYGKLRLRLVTDSLSVETVWNDLENPPIAQEDLPMPLSEHPSTKFREAGPERFATVRVDGRDWSRVLSVGRLDGRVVACFVDGRSLMLHVYLPQPDDPDDGEEQSLITLGEKGKALVVGTAYWWAIGVYGTGRYQKIVRVYKI